MKTRRCVLYLIILVLSVSFVSGAVTINTFLDDDFSRQSKLFGKNANVYVSVYNGVSCCASYTFTAANGGISKSFSVTDDGTGLDNKANDGVFKGMFLSPDLSLQHHDQATISVEFTPISKSSETITAEYGKPSSVVISATLVDRDVKLSWTKSDDESGVEYYIIYKAKESLNSGNLQAAKQIITYTTEYTDKNLLDGDAYYYAVVPVDILGNAGDISNQKLISINDHEPPLPVDQITAVYENNAIKLEWEKSFDNSGVITYYLYRDTSPVRRALTSSYAEVSSTKFVDSDIDDEDVLYYAIVAVDAAGNKASISPYVKVVIDTLPPSKPTLDHKLRKSGEVILFWTSVAGTDQYYIYSSTNKNIPLNTPIRVSGTSTSYTETIAEDRYYVMAALDKAGNLGDLSNQIYVQPDDEPPVTVTSLKAAANEDGTVSLSWDATASEDLLTYKIYRSTSHIVDYTVPLFTTKDTVYHDTSVERGKTYYYTVRVVDRAGNEDSNTNTVSVAVQDLKVDLEVWYPENNQELNRAIVIVGGKAEHDAAVLISVNNNEIPHDRIVMDKKGVFLAPVTLKAGSNVIMVKAIDNENNVASKSVVVHNSKDETVKDPEIQRIITLLRDQFSDGELKIGKDATLEIGKVDPGLTNSDALAKFTGYSVKSPEQVNGSYVAILLLLIVFLGFYLVMYNKTAVGKKKGGQDEDEDKKEDIFTEDDFKRELEDNDDMKNEFY
ncbi:hypothetical protein HYY69_01630 [Candidatus Woesearchaeota archaeon]|nr:hypothetical protein [Candidatus Woesearchaeota archaeon]